MELKNRYLTLDGLRGVAAICVVIHHVSLYRGAGILAPHGNLAVDFFLMLSGFVIAKSYKGPVHAGLSVVEFAKRRLIRLYPVALIGLMLGGFKLLTESGLGHDGPAVIQVIIACALNIFLLPYWAASPFFGEIFPTDPPIWSLFAELGLNIGWAAAEKFSARRDALACLMVACGVISFLSIMFYGVETIRYGSLFGPIFRVIFAFLVGVWLVEYEAPISKIPFPHPALLSVLLCATLLMPWTSVAWDVLAIYVLLPLILVCGIASGREDDHGVRKFLGDISYPLYVIHYPIFLLISGFLHRFPFEIRVEIAAGFGMISSFAAATLIYRYADLPMRAALSRFLAGRRSIADPMSQPMSAATGQSEHPLVSR